MRQKPATVPITIRTAKETMDEIDWLAAAVDRSRSYVINQAIQQYQETNAWQVICIKAGLATAREGRVRPADTVFADIAAKHGWQG